MTWSRNVNLPAKFSGESDVMVLRVGFFSWNSADEPHSALLTPKPRNPWLSDVHFRYQDATGALSPTSRSARGGLATRYLPPSVSLVAAVSN